MYLGHGTYEIKDVPTGKVLVKTWYEKLKNGRRKMSVPEAGKKTVDLYLTRGTAGALYK